MPPPRESVKELILQNVVQTLLAVRQGGSAANGAVYWNDFKRVERKIVRSPDLSGIVLMVIAPDYVPNDREGGTSNTGIVKKTMRLQIMTWSAKESSSDTFNQRIMQDVETAICQDRDRGGHAFNTTVSVGGVVTDENTEPWSAIVQEFEIDYKHEYGNPSAQV